MSGRTAPGRTALGRRGLLALTGLGALALTGCGDDAADSGSRPPTRRIAYGDDPSQFGELSLPRGDPEGVVVVIHGGYWRSEYGLGLGRPVARDLVSRGWAAWNLEYRRVGNGGGVPATLDDIAAGIDTLADRDLGLDLDRVVALGHSAGGHLAAWAASRGRFPQWPEHVRLTSVVSQAGLLDLRDGAATGLGNGAIEAFLGHPYGPADAPVDPIAQVPLDVPVTCVHGDADIVVPLSQSRSYVEAATAAGAEATLVVVPGADHFDLVDPQTTAWARCVAAVEADPGR